MSRKKQDGGNQDKQRAKGFCSAIEPPVEEVAEVEQMKKILHDERVRKTTEHNDPVSIQVVNESDLADAVADRWNRYNTLWQF